MQMLKNSHNIWVMDGCLMSSHETIFRYIMGIRFINGGYHRPATINDKL